MTKDIVSAITNKLIQYITMEKIQLPDFLNTIEKYNKVVHETNTIKKYEIYSMHYLKTKIFL